MKKSVKTVFAVLLVMILAFTVYVPAAQAKDGPAGYTATNTVPSTSGKYYLTQDVKLSGVGVAINDGEDVTLDLMGHSITQSTADKTVFNMNGGKYTIEDSVGGGVIYAAEFNVENSLAGTIASLKGNSEFVIKNAILDGSANAGKVSVKSAWGGAIWLGGDGVKLQIDGGKFRNFSCPYGAVIGGAKYSSIVINGGEFYNNTSLRANEDGTTTVNMNAGGAVIALNKAKETAQATLTINGGVFHNNTARNGGVILVNGYCTDVTINGGEFYANQAIGQEKVDTSAGCGSGGVMRTIRDDGSKVIINGGEYHNNQSDESVGGVFCFGSPAEVHGGRFYQNKSGMNGSAIYTTKALILENATVVNNYVKGKDNSGAVYVSKDKDITLGGVLCIKDNMKAGGYSNMRFGSTADVSGVKAGSLVCYSLSDAALVFGKNASADMVNMFKPDKAATHTAFSGGELTRVDGAVNPEYAITDGKDAEYETGSGKELSFTTDGAMDKLEDVLIDGRVVDPSNYTIDGSKITFKSSFLDTLSGKTKMNPDGKHTLALTFTGARCSVAQFATPNGGPETGDSSLLLLWVSLIALAALGFVVLKKKGYQG